MSLEDLDALLDRLGPLARREPSTPARAAYVYGAGGFGRRIARELARHGRPVLGFIDARAAAIGTVDSLPCLDPADLSAADAAAADFVLGVMNDTTDSAGAVAWAAALCFADLLFPATLRTLPGFEADTYWFGAPERTLGNREALRWLDGALADEASRRLLRDLLAYRLTTDPRLHPPVDPDAYHPDFLALRDRPVTFVDGGAYTGDTLDALVAACVPVADWLAFEPDAGNAAALVATARRHRDAIGGFVLTRAALSDHTGPARFAGSRGGASALLPRAADEPGETVDAVRLDDVASRPGEVYVKLDVEGAEAAALAGMCGFLARRPRLAVSVYHRPEDLWEIPRTVVRLYERPLLRLRQHGHHGFDTVLYVTPG